MVAQDGPAVASPMEACKLNGVIPQRYRSDVLTRLVNGLPSSRIEGHMPWCWAKAASELPSAVAEGTHIASTEHPQAVNCKLHLDPKEVLPEKPPILCCFRGVATRTRIYKGGKDRVLNVANYQTRFAIVCRVVIFFLKAQNKSDQDAADMLLRRRPCSMNC
jgi:hypothetical protein